MRTLTALMLLMSAALLGAAADSTASSIPAPVLQVFDGINLEQAIAQCEVIPAYSRDEKGAFDANDILVGDLTPKEMLLVRTLRDAAGSRFGCGTTIMFAVGYASRYNKLPANSFDLMRMNYPELLTSERAERLVTLDPAEQLAELKAFINPATGRLYPSFHSDGWTQYGVSIEKLVGEAATKLIPYIGTKQPSGEKISEMRPYQGWRIVVYGETPGRVLIDKLNWTEIEQQPPVG